MPPNPRMQPDAALRRPRLVRFLKPGCGGTHAIAIYRCATADAQSVRMKPYDLAAWSAGRHARAELVRQIEACLAGTLDTGALAGLSTDFMPRSLAKRCSRHGAEELVADMLTCAHVWRRSEFCMEQQDLRGLIARLGSV